MLVPTDEEQKRCPRGAAEPSAAQGLSWALHHPMGTAL